eukprot:357613-Chlamydomonas_euryale.AAC.6
MFGNCTKKSACAERDTNGSNWAVHSGATSECAAKAPSARSRRRFSYRSDACHIANASSTCQQPRLRPCCPTYRASDHPSKGGLGTYVTIHPNVGQGPT